MGILPNTYSFRGSIEAYGKVLIRPEELVQKIGAVVKMQVKASGNQCLVNLLNYM